MNYDLCLADLQEEEKKHQDVSSELIELLCMQCFLGSINELLYEWFIGKADVYLLVYCGA